MKAPKKSLSGAAAALVSLAAVPAAQSGGPRDCEPSGAGEEPLARRKTYQAHRTP